MQFLSIDTGLFLEKLTMVAVVVFALLGIALYTTFAERKVAGFMQDRYGPNRAGPLACSSHWPTVSNSFSKKNSYP